MYRIWCILLVTGMLFIACQGTEEPQEKGEAQGQGEQPMAILVSSPVFDEEGMIPVKYTCDGDDISPPLLFDGIPAEAKSLALISDDPDAPMGTWVHWVMYNLPPDTREMPEKIASDEKLENGAIHGVTDFGRYGYGGPCPPSGTHRYYFKVYALDTMLDLSGKIDKKALVAAMEGHILAEGQLMGKYKRR
jgi:Raf kinase inhibitor-like YbhB/YbcL family protein